MSEPEALGTIIKRLSGKGMEGIPEEVIENTRYLKRQWLNDITFQVRTNLGEECLAWNPYAVTWCQSMTQQVLPGVRSCSAAR